jgi:metal-responsive CopG/Arc/MetJ family transcriptional regulator
MQEECYTDEMKKKNGKILTLNLDERICQKVDKFRYRREFPSRTQAIEFLLDYALAKNPVRPGQEKGE